MIIIHLFSQIFLDDDTGTGETTSKPTMITTQLTSTGKNEKNIVENITDYTFSSNIGICFIDRNLNQ